MADPIGFLGMTHLGSVMSACWASMGHPVIAVGEPATVTEPGFAELDVRMMLRITSSPSALGHCALVFVTLDTSDVALVDGLLERSVPWTPTGSTIVVMSQIPPGTTRQLAARWPLHEFYYLAETLITGKAVERCLHPDRFILGCARPPWVGGLLGAVLGRFQCPILTMSYESAEFAKLAINLYLASSIQYANRMAAAAKLIGADWLNEVVPALRLDPRIGRESYLRPGEVGFNIGRDIRTLERLEAKHERD